MAASSPPSTSADFTVLILDIVTTGQKSEAGEIIEIAAALYSVKYRCVISQISTLLPTERTAEAQHVPVGAALTVKTHQAEAIGQILLSWAAEAKYCIAHNAEQDRAWIQDHWLLAPLLQRPWLCSAYDFVWPRQQRPGMNLVHLALAHGISLTCANRALSACQLIAALLTQTAETLLDVIAAAARPKCKVLVQTQCLGFKWDATARAWSRWLAIAELPAIPVKYTVVEVEPRGQEAIVWARLWQMYISHKRSENPVERSVVSEELGRQIWQAVKGNAAMAAAVRRLWLDSERGGIKPKGLLDAFTAMEVWYWTTRHPLMTTQKTTLFSHGSHKLPDALGSESGDATSLSDDISDALTASVEGVVEKVAESCLEPEDRREGSCFSPSLLSCRTGMSD